MVKRKRKSKFKKNKKVKKNKMGKIDYKIFFTVLILVAIGVLRVFSASAYYALYTEGNLMFFMKKQLMWVPIGLIAMFIIMSIDYHVWKRFTVLGYFATVIALIAVLFMPDMNGATRWLYIGPLSFQPSELAKYILVFMLAMSIENRSNVMNKYLRGTIVSLAIAGLLAGLVLLENNLSITAVIMFVAVIMSYVGGMNLKDLYSIVPTGLLVGFFFIITSEYRWKRIVSFINPYKYYQEGGYQLIHSYYALGSGGFFGQGLGNSKQKALYMPEPHNDFIFAIIGEEFGFIGCFIIILLFTFLILCGFNIAKRAKDKYGRLVATGITSVLACQALINVAVVTGSMPVTGVPLPFISYGGTSLVFNLAAMGVLLNISRQGRVPISKEVVLKDSEEEKIKFLYNN